MNQKEVCALNYSTFARNLFIKTNIAREEKNFYES